MLSIFDIDYDAISGQASQSHYRARSLSLIDEVPPMLDTTMSAACRAQTQDSRRTATSD